MTGTTDNLEAHAPGATSHYRLFQFHRARAVTYTLILLLGVLGTLIIDNHPKSYWGFSWIMVLFDILLINAFFAYCRYHRFARPRLVFWRQLQQWAVLLAAIYGVFIMVNTALLKPVQAGIVTTLLFGLSCCNIGWDTDRSLVCIGALFLVLAPLSALITEHLMLSCLPIFAVTGVAIFAMMVSEHIKIRRQKS